MLLYIGIAGYAIPYLFLGKKLVKLPELIWSFFSYLFFSFSYIFILQIYAFCRVDDLSWGTRPEVQGEGSLTLFNYNLAELIKELKEKGLFNFLEQK